MNRSHRIVWDSHSIERLHFIIFLLNAKKRHQENTKLFTEIFFTMKILFMSSLNVEHKTMKMTKKKHNSSKKKKAKCKCFIRCAILRFFFVLFYVSLLNMLYKIECCATNEAREEGKWNERKTRKTFFFFYCCLSTLLRVYILNNITVIGEM